MGAVITALVLILTPQLLRGTAEPPVLAIKATTALQEDGQHRCFVSIVNQSSKAALGNVRATIFADQRARFSVGPINLAPGQATVFEQDINREMYCSDADQFFRVTYEQQGATYDLILEGQRKPTTTLSAKGILGQIIPWVLGLLSAILGGWLTHHLTVIREREKDRVNRGTKQYDALVPAFRDFLKAWGANPVPETLQAHFSDLESKVILDSQTFQSYRETYKVLADQTLPMNRKRDAAVELDRKMRAYIEDFDINGVA